ncbi:MAG: molybdenum cofactor biosynthesis protein MoaE [Pseudomonadota bacterium]
MTVRLQTEAFDPGAALKTFSGQLKNAGAVVSFTGVVRDVEVGLRHMEIEHYPGMTEKAISEIVATARDRWPIVDVLVIHRHGQLRPGEVIMMVATASAHRKAAFEAAEYLMDYLKSRAPFWKKEITKVGADWVAAKEDDETALGRW